MPTRENQTIRFGPFEVDLRTEELRRNGEKVKLQSQPIRVLAIFLEKPGELVTREELQRRIWPEDTFVDFEQSLNTTIRKLRNALGDDAEEPMYIETLPKRGYRFIAQLGDQPANEEIAANGDVPKREAEADREAASTVVAATEIQARRFRWAYVAIAAGIVVLLVAVVLLIGVLRRPEPVVSPLITIPGAAYMPAFSPDGDRVAFVHYQRPAEQSKADVYVKSIPDGSLLKLTNVPGAYLCPRFSPDGKYLGFFLSKGDESGVYVMPALGGSVGKLVALHPWSGCFDWSPDGKGIVYSDSERPNQGGVLHYFDLATMSDSKIIPTGDLPALFPQYSPDGKWIAFAPTMWGSVYVIPASGGTPRELKDSCGFGFSWTPDSRDVVLIGFRNGAQVVLRHPISGGWGEPVLTNASPDALFSPTVSPKHNRLVYLTSSGESETIYRINLPHAGKPSSGAPQTLIASMSNEELGQISPDGKKIAFQSTRTSGFEIWLSESDGSNQLQLTHTSGDAGLTGTPRWSPDGKWISYGHNGVYIISANGGAARKLPLCGGISSWSHDGKWIYCDGPKVRETQIWRVSVETGEAHQITQNGGFNAFESSDRKDIYFTKWNTNGVFRVPIAGGQETKVIDYPPAPAWAYWVLEDDGIYYIVPNTDSGSDVRAWLEFYEFASGSSKRVAPIKHLLNPNSPGFSISPDRTWMIYSGMERYPESHMMMLEHLR